MSWATCYDGANNVYPDFPAIMSDGRNYTTYQPEAVINNAIREKENIQSNWDYRKYLTQNATTIIKYNKLQTCVQNGNTSYLTPNLFSGTPVFFHNSFGEDKMNKSDLKSPYLSRQQLQLQYISPTIYKN